MDRDVNEGVDVRDGLEHVQEQSQSFATVGCKGAGPVHLGDWDPPDLVEDQIGFSAAKESRILLLPIRGQCKQKLTNSTHVPVRGGVVEEVS